jgi:hypothetical protein
MTDDDTTTRLTRRDALGLLTGASISAGALTLASNPTTAATAGNTVATRSNPADVMATDRIQLVSQSSDPSSPSDGDIWYNP